MKTAAAHNAPLTGKIEFLVPDNEFSNDIGAMPSMDTMYAAYLKYYNKCICRTCGKEFWIKKPHLRDLCPKHLEESMFPKMVDNEDEDPVEL